ncbi:unnamed protein product [Gongylonema pulchrum]|uniref:WS_DGAT_C domain-containing protein n=1 Tax=Gongylonema pulchrum TaxID=637853 RepID=A0A183EG95_9BILA|nr:unnamed protein product [Gongylonema pulchrum]
MLPPQSIVTSNGVGLLPARSPHFFSLLEGHPGVNIVYMDEGSGQAHTIHYVDMGAPDASQHMDTLEQIVQSSEMTLEDVKNDLGEDETKQLNLI